MATKKYSYLVESIIRYHKGNVLRFGIITLCNLGKDKVKSLKPKVTIKHGNIEI